MLCQITKLERGSVFKYQQDDGFLLPEIDKKNFSTFRRKGFRQESYMNISCWGRLFESWIVLSTG